MTPQAIDLLLNELRRGAVVNPDTLDQARAYVAGEQKDLDALIDDVRARIPVASADRRLTPEEQRTASTAARDLAVLAGTRNASDVGASDERVARWALDGRPTLRTLRAWAASLDAVPAPILGGKFRYVGPRYAHHAEGGRFLVAGEIVTLTPTQAKAFADRFERVEPEPAPETAT